MPTEMIPATEVLKRLYEPTQNEQHIYHHGDSQPASFDVKIEKNSRSYNWTISVHGCKDRAEADKLLAEADMVVKSFITTQATEG